MMCRRQLVTEFEELVQKLVAGVVIICALYAFVAPQEPFCLLRSNHRAMVTFPYSALDFGVGFAARFEFDDPQVFRSVMWAN